MLVAIVFGHDIHIFIPKFGQSDKNLLEIILSLSGKETIQEQYKKSFLLILSQCVISIRTKSDHYLL